MPFLANEKDLKLNSTDLIRAFLQKSKYCFLMDINVFIWLLKKWRKLGGKNDIKSK